MKETSRRRLLTTTGTAVSSFSIAGCSSNSGGGNGTQTDRSQPTTDGTVTQEPTTTEDTSGTGEPVGADQLSHWVPANTAYEFEVRAAVLYDGDLETIREHENDFYSGTYELISQTLLGPNLANILQADKRERVVQIAMAATVIARTSMSEEELQTALRDAGLAESGSRGDATLYEGELNGTSSMTAVLEGVVIQAFGASATSTVESVLAARAGELARLVDTSTPIGDVSGAVGDDELSVLTERAEDTPSGDPSLDGATALGYGWQFGADSSDLTVAVTYDSADQTSDPSAVGSYFTEQERFSDYDNIQSSIDGNTVLVTGSIPTNEFDLLSSGTPGESGGNSSTAPQIQFSIEFESDTMTVTHDGGDAVTASNLTLIIGSGPVDTQFTDEYEEVTAGDSISVDVSDVDSGTQVALVWSEGENSAILTQTQVP